MLTHLNRRVFLPPEASLAVGRFEAALRAAGPPLLFGLRLWASVTLALYVAFWLELDNPFWAGTSAAIVCLPQLGASLRKGWFRMIGTFVGAVMSVLLVAWFPQDRLLFLGALSVWCAACSFVSVLLRNFASYAAMLAGYTVAIIALDPVIDATIGESSQIRYRSPILQQAVDGLFAALAGWRAVANHLARLPRDRARDETALIRPQLPAELRAQPGQAKPTHWIADPTGWRRICETTVQRLLSLPAETPSLRLLLDKTAEALAGLAQALNGVALLVAEPASPAPRCSGLR